MLWNRKGEPAFLQYQQLFDMQNNLRTLERTAILVLRCERLGMRIMCQVAINITLSFLTER
jgi:hypothetical protein